MDREAVIQNIMKDYGKYGIIRGDIEPLICESEEDGRSYDFIYFFLQLTLADICGLEFFWGTARQMARAFNISDNKMLKVIKETSKELNVKENGLDDYFKIPVEIVAKFLV